MLVLKHTRPFHCMVGMLLSGSVQAYDEIQVYNQSINAPDQFGLEMHMNYVIDGRQTPDFKGELPPNNILAITNEFSYGLTRYIELGLYLPLSIDVQRNISFMDAAKARIKFLNADDLNLYYGLNIELGIRPRRYAEETWGGELRPIIGTKQENWFIAFNPNIEFNLTGDLTPEFAPSLKFGHLVFDNVYLGFEHYAGLGVVNNLEKVQNHSHTSYLTTDFTVGKINLNVGIGRGWDKNSDDWTVKLIIGGIPFMDMIMPR